MSIIDKILLQLYFPKFDSPSTSRFESLFLFLRKTDGNKKNNISYKIFPERVIRGEDKRTSILIKNIPINMKKKDIRSMVEKYGNINFLVLSKEEKKENYIKAYLNVINYKSIVPIYMNLRKVKFKYKEKILNIQIIYSEVQGKIELKKIFNNEYFDK